MTNYDQFHNTFDTSFRPFKMGIGTARGRDFAFICGLKNPEFPTSLVGQIFIDNQSQRLSDNVEQCFHSRADIEALPEN